jgi:serine protease Do
MNTRILPLVLLAAGISFSAAAQTKEKSSDTKKEKSESITIRKKGDSKEKLTIVVDGDNITVNGKPLEDLKDTDVEILRNEGIRSLMPRIRGRINAMPRGSMKMFGDGFPFEGNKAFLGVVSEKDEKGAKISSVEKESAAEKAGLKKDDIITKVGDTKISDSNDLYDAIGKHNPDDKVTITYLRNGKEATATATLGKNNAPKVRSFNFNGDDFKFEMPEMPRLNGLSFDMPRKPRLGLEIQDLEEGKGVKVLDVDSETPAAKAGLQKDDVITEVNGKTIASVDELREQIRSIKEGDTVKVTYSRAGKTQTTDIKFPKRLKTADL